MYLYNTDYIISSNALTVAATLLFLDLFFTLDDEVNYIWMQPFRLSTFLFLVNRYLPFVDTLLGLYLSMTVTTPEMCANYHMGITWLIAIGLMVSESILLLRTWSMWQRSKKIFYGLSAMSICTFGPGIYVTVKEIRSFRFVPVPPGGLGCHLQSASKLILVAYILIAFSETVVVVLTIMKGITHLRNSNRSWVKHVYRHGLLFYLYLLAFTIVNIIIPLAAPEPHYKDFLAVPQRVIHSILCNRVILQIEGQRMSRTHTSSELSRGGTISKTGNILESAIQTNYTTRGDLDILSDPGDDEHEMCTYRQDWIT